MGNYPVKLQFIKTKSQQGFPDFGSITHVPIIPMQNPAQLPYFTGRVYFTSAYHFTAFL
jgi:hypothetical protein